MSKLGVPSKNNIGNKPIVFFDGGCPLCRREINHYRRMRSAENLTWIDISHPESGLEHYGLDLQLAMRRFHVLDANGNWQTGAFGFAEMWSKLSGYRLLAAVLRFFHLLPLLDFFYVKFAGWRLQRRCDEGACVTSGPCGKK